MSLKLKIVSYTKKIGQSKHSDVDFIDFFLLNLKQFNSLRVWKILAGSTSFFFDSV